MANEYLVDEYLVNDYLVSFTEGDDMADFNGAKPVQTVRDDEFKIQIVDGASGENATNKLSILAEADALAGKFGVLVFGEDASGNAANLPIGTNGVKVEASDLDIRDLNSATDSVTVIQGTDPWNVAATDLDIRNLDKTVDSVSAEITNTVTVQATDLDVRPLTFATDSVDVSGSSVTVSATDLDVRDLTHVSDSIKIGDGTEFLAVNADGSINVVVQDASGTDVCDFQTTATVGASSVVNHDYVVTSGLTFYGQTVLVGARGAVKVEVGTWDGTTFVPKFVYFQDPKENKDHNIARLSLLGDGTATIRLRITNTDGQSSDVYSTLQGDVR